MRIAQVCPYDIGRPGGVQRHILDTAEALRELGHEVTVIAPATDGDPIFAGKGDVRRMGQAVRIGLAGTSFEISLARGDERRKLAALMRSGFDIAHFHTPWVPFVAPQALADYEGPAVATFHDTPAATITGHAMAFLFRQVGRFLLPRFAMVLTPSEAPLAWGHLKAARRTEAFAPCTDLRPFRDALPMPGFADGRIKILFLGRLEPRKGAMILLEAYRMLSARALPLRLIVAGAGKEEAKLRAYAARHALPHVEFVGAPRDTASWFAAADIFCAPAPHGESFGIVIAEAMAAGRPVVAAANGGYRTLLTGEASRFLTRPGSASELVEALEALARDAGLRARLGAWGREESRRYDCRHLAPRLLAIYEDAIRRHALTVRNAT
jgi:phosphatidylinositol alpha-mannosyltransferase